MNLYRYRFFIMILFLVSLLLCACQPGNESTPENLPETGLDTGSCEPTPPDQLGPFYKPDAPIRDSVGEGYVLSGEVMSAENCLAIADAQIEFWMAGPDGEYRDEYRATLFSGDQGEYQFESHFPPPYSGRPSHIHIRVTAPGFQELVTQHYPIEGEEEANFELVLTPEG